MKMKDFKAALESKLRYAEKNLKVEDDYYLGYISCMEDILVFIDGGEIDGCEEDGTYIKKNERDCHKSL